MKRNTISGALFAAPLIAASLVSATAFADARNVIALQLDPVCVDAASNTAMFALQNKNDFELPVTWENLDTGDTGSFVVPANSFDGYDTPMGYYTSYDPSIAGNNTAFYAEGWTSPATTNVHADQACTADQLPAVDEGTTGDEGNTGTDTPTTGGTDTTGGGRGEGQVLGTSTAATPATATVAAAPAAATLADTGASQILPYTAAALIAVAMIGATIAVRKNLI